MTRFLLATDSVHTTAAGCDYLSDRLEGDDAVIALTVLEDAGTERDAADALNVATVRLPTATETARREGTPAPAILDAAGARDADEIVLVETESGAMSSTVRAVIADADRPVVVVSPA